MVIIVAQKIVTVYLSDTMYLWLYFDDDVKLTVIIQVNTFLQKDIFLLEYM